MKVTKPCNAPLKTIASNNLHGLKFFIGREKMNVSISIDFSQLKTVISQCNLEEKLELFQLLEQDTFSVRFKKFLNSVQTNELNLEDITNEVEAVRQANYHAR